MRKFSELLRWIAWFFNVLRHRRGTPSYSMDLVKSNHEEFLLKYRASEESYSEAIVIVERLVNFLACEKHFKLLRRGQKEGDGGYFVSSSIEPTKVISFGVGSNISFDLDFEEHISVFMFDHTVAQPKNLPHNIFFFGYGISNKSMGKFKDIKDAFALSKVDSDDRVLLKIDIEGGEYDLDFTDLDSGSIDQIVIELHNIEKILDRDFRKKFISLLEYFEQNFICIYAVGNNFTGVTSYGKYVLPNTIEVTMLSKKFMSINEGEVKHFLSRNNLSKPPLYPFYEGK